MIVLTLGQSAENFIVTLTEKTTLASGYYLFVFTNVPTKTVVTKIYAFTEDLSAYPSRFNEFLIDTNTVFTGKPPGEWIYEVYEQASASNTDVTGLTEVERGIFTLNPAADFSFTKYEAATSFKVYAG